MTSLLRHDLIDIFKVNTASWGVYGLSNSDLIQLNEMVQQTGNSLLIILAVSYTIVKIVKAVREMKWEKEDRENDTL